MAPSHILIALLVAFAVVSPAAQATRAHGEAAAAAPAPGEAVLHLSATPLIPLIPCSMVPDIPFLKDVLHLICYDDKPTPPPKPCRPLLMGVAKPCGAFLTNNASVPAPPTGCCDGYSAVVDQELDCICRIANGDIAQLLPAPVNMTRVFALSDACGSPLTLKYFTHCERMVLFCRRWMLRVLHRRHIKQERQAPPV
ncbi:hypothetical protein ACP70R_005494 [Stipagrostis hirtigluma subsp. patula]